MPLARALPDIRHYVWAPLFVLLVGLGATAALSWQMARLAESKDGERFRSLAQQTRANLAAQLEAHSATLRIMASLFAATGGLSARAFQAHVQDIERRDASLLGVAWIRRGSPNRRLSPAARLKVEGEPYTVALIEPAGWRYHETPDYAFFRDARTLAAIAQARDSGTIVASAPVPLSPDFWSRQRRSIHLVHPVYRGSPAPDSVAQKRRRLTGMVDLMLDADEMLAVAHAGQGELALNVVDIDPQDGNAPLFRSGSRGAPSRSAPPLHSDSLYANVAGRTWKLEFRSTPEFEAASDRRLIPTVALVGVLITLLLASANLFQSRARAALNASELRYRRLFEASPDGVFLFDAHDGVLTDANPYMVELLGRTREQLIGKPLWDIGLFPDAGQARAAHRQLLEKPYHRFEQFPVTAPSGQRWHVDITCNAYATGGRRMIQCNVRNVTDRKRAQDALRDSEERYRTLVEVSPQGVWTADSAGLLTYANQFWIEYSGTNVRTAWSEQVHPSDRERVREAWLDALLAGSAFATEMRLRRAADGEYRWHLARAVPLHGGDNEAIDHWLGVFVDIHERKQSEEDRDRLLSREQALRSEAEAANRAKDDFLAMLSHELRTPLNAILGWTQTLQRGEVSRESLLRAMSRIEASANAQARLVNDLLNVADISAGRLRLDIQPVNLVSLVEGVAQSLQPAMEARQVRYQAQLDDAAGEVAADPSRLQQIVWNLLSNAIKFTPRGGLIRLELQRAPEHVEIAVVDSGEGIKPEFLPYVFDRFRQADASTKRRHGGLGLGLAIVRHLAELHGGSVSAQSEGEGRGARFAVRLPLQAPGSATAGMAPARRHAKAAGAPATHPSPLHGLRILSVDDDAAAREMLHEALERCGAEVQSAASAQQAFDGLQAFRPDVVVSDIGLPGEDGYDLIHRIRALPVARLARTPAVALTGFARPQDREAVLEAGFDAFASKPVDLNELIGILVRLTQEKGKRRQVTGNR
jgi:PAS domain S-box-containing protein